MTMHEMPMNSERTTRESDQKTGQEVSPEDSNDTASPDDPAAADAASATSEKVREIGGRQGPDPTRYGDWEKGGRCIDF
jgi:hypothetical protein